MAMKRSMLVFMSCNSTVLHLAFMGVKHVLILRGKNTIYKCFKTKCSRKCADLREMKWVV
jgi:hypothetical protein